MPSTGGLQRAAEITSAMLNVPGYADDTLLFMMRYGSLAKETLRKVDWDEFTARLSAMNEHWFEGGSSVSVGCRGTGEGDAADEAAAGGEARDDDAVDPPASEPEPDAKAAELKARTLELIQDFPRLVRDFDKFVDCTRVTATRYGARNKR